MVIVLVYFKGAPETHQTCTDDAPTTHGCSHAATI